MNLNLPAAVTKMAAIGNNKKREDDAPMTSHEDHPSESQVLNTQSTQMSQNLSTISDIITCGQRTSRENLANICAFQVQDFVQKQNLCKLGGRF